MKAQKTKNLVAITLCILVSIFASEVCIAQDYSRQGKSEIFGMFQTWSGDTLDVDLGLGYGESGTIGSSTLYGLGAGYNYTDNLNLNTDWLFGSQDWTLTIPSMGSATEKMSISNWDINLDYNILKSRFTPLVTGGFGFCHISDDYLASETDLSFNVGLGCRWDITDNIAIKALYRLTWVDIQDADMASFDGFTLSVIIKW